MNRRGYVSEQISDKIYTALSDYFDDIVKLPKFFRLPEPVSSHADMLLYKLNGSILMHEKYYDMNHKLFSDVNVTLTDEYISDKYPHDILLNALNLRDIVYGKKDFISRYIKAETEHIVDLRQGYARCSVCVVTESAVITSDHNIARNLTDTDVLFIRSGHIGLYGYDYGFIGGASVTIDDNVLFFGDITAHPDYESILKFCEKHNVQVVSLSDEMLYDYGAMVII